jgi:hypothetical protein
MADRLDEFDAFDWIGHYFAGRARFDYDPSTRRLLTLA